MLNWSVSYHKTGYLAFALVVQANFPWQGWCAHTATADMHTPLLTLMFADKGMAGRGGGAQSISTQVAKDAVQSITVGTERLSVMLLRLLLLRLLGLQQCIAASVLLANQTGSSPQTRDKGATMKVLDSEERILLT